MKMKSRPVERRPYRQGARAQAAEETGQRILDAFLVRLGEQWFDEITLDALALDAGVTVQTIVRRFGGKQGLLEAARESLGREVENRRGTVVGDIARAVDAVLADYEADGDFIMRLLAQEDRYPVLRVVSDYGRAGHREWIARTFAPWLDPLQPAARQATLDALVVATDLYVWKLVRRDMRRPLPAVRAVVTAMIKAALAAAPSKET